MKLLKIKMKCPYPMSPNVKIDAHLKWGNMTVEVKNIRKSKDFFHLDTIAIVKKDEQVKEL